MVVASSRQLMNEEPGLARATSGVVIKSSTVSKKKEWRKNHPGFTFRIICYVEVRSLLWCVHLYCVTASAGSPSTTGTSSCPETSLTKE